MMESVQSLFKHLPPGRLDTGLLALRRLVSDPTNPEVGLLYLRTLDGDLHAEMAQSMMDTPEGRRLLRDRPRLDAASLRLDELARLPTGSLGQVYARFFRERGLKPFPTTAPIESDANYVTNRLRETHDLWHLVTGYGTHVNGELELQAFSYGNLRNPSSLLLLSFVPGVKARADFEGMPGWLTSAYRRGRACRSLAGVFWEDLWEKPLAELRAELCAPQSA